MCAVKLLMIPRLFLAPCCALRENAFWSYKVSSSMIHTRGLSFRCYYCTNFTSARGYRLAKHSRSLPFDMWYLPVGLKAFFTFTVLHLYEKFFLGYRVTITQKKKIFFQAMADCSLDLKSRAFLNRHSLNSICFTDIPSVIYCWLIDTFCIKS